MGDFVLYVIFGFLLTVFLTCTACALYVQRATRKKWERRVCICKYNGAWGVVLARSYHEWVDDYCDQVLKGVLSTIRGSGIPKIVAIAPEPIVIFHSEAIMHKFLVGCFWEEVPFFVPIVSSQGQSVEDPIWLYRKLHPDEAFVPQGLERIVRENYHGTSYGQDEFVPASSVDPDDEHLDPKREYMLH